MPFILYLSFFYAILQACSSGRFRQHEAGEFYGLLGDSSYVSVSLDRYRRNVVILNHRRTFGQLGDSPDVSLAPWTGIEGMSQSGFTIYQYFEPYSSGYICLGHCPLLLFCPLVPTLQALYTQAQGNPPKKHLTKFFCFLMKREAICHFLKDFIY